MASDVAFFARPLANRSGVVPEMWQGLCEFITCEPEARLEEQRPTKLANRFLMPAQVSINAPEVKVEIERSASASMAASNASFASAKRRSRKSQTKEPGHQSTPGSRLLNPSTPECFPSLVTALGDGARNSRQLSIMASREGCRTSVPSRAFAGPVPCRLAARSAHARSALGPICPLVPDSATRLLPCARSFLVVGQR